MTARITAAEPASEYTISFGGTFLISLTALRAFSRVTTFGFSSLLTRGCRRNVGAGACSGSRAGAGGSATGTKSSFSGGNSFRSEKLTVLVTLCSAAPIIGSVRNFGGAATEGSSVAADIVSCAAEASDWPEAPAERLVTEGALGPTPAPAAAAFFVLPPVDTFGLVGLSTRDSKRPGAASA